MKVCASIIPVSAEELQTQLKKLSPYFGHFQIDIEDGQLASLNTMPIDQITPLLFEYPNTTFDFHLMMYDFGKAINYLRNLTTKIKIGNIFVHHKASPPPALFEGTSGAFSIGLAINPDEEVKQLSALYSFEKMAVIQVMSIQPGPQGQAFMKETLRKIEQLRLLNYRNDVYLDGGINSETIPFILSQHFPPDVLCIGSYLTQSRNLEERVKRLKEMLVV